MWKNTYITYIMNYVCEEWKFKETIRNTDGIIRTFQLRKSYPVTTDGRWHVTVEITGILASWPVVARAMYSLSSRHRRCLLCVFSSGWILTFFHCLILAPVSSVFIYFFFPYVPCHTPRLSFIQWWWCSNQR